MVLIKLPLTAILMTNVKKFIERTSDQGSVHKLLHVFILFVVNFLSQVIFVFLLFVGMVMHANEVKTKEKYKLPEIKHSLQHTLLLYFA